MLQTLLTFCVDFGPWNINTNMIYSDQKFKRKSPRSWYESWHSVSYKLNKFGTKWPNTSFYATAQGFLKKNWKFEYKSSEVQNFLEWRSCFWQIENHLVWWAIEIQMIISIRIISEFHKPLNLSEANKTTWFDSSALASDSKLKSLVRVSYSAQLQNIHQFYMVWFEKKLSKCPNDVGRTNL